MNLVQTRTAGDNLTTAVDSTGALLPGCTHGAAAVAEH